MFIDLDILLCPVLTFHRQTAERVTNESAVLKWPRHFDLSQSVYGGLCVTLFIRRRQLRVLHDSRD